jgi:hypothetical protein
VAILSNASLHLWSGAQELIRAQQQQLPQRDDLCGAFWGAAALAALDKRNIIEEDVAELAGVTVALSYTSDHPAARPPGVAPNLDYRRELPRSSRPESAGTSATGLVRAIPQASEERLEVLPTSGPFSVERLASLFDELEVRTAPFALLANVATKDLWCSHATWTELLDYLNTGLDDGPASEWAVGHWIALLGTVTGTKGTLVLVADTYPSLGAVGLHLQPIERLARALEGRGLLLVSLVEHCGDIARDLETAKLTIGAWDNGSTDRHDGDHGRSGRR